MRTHATIGGLAVILLSSTASSQAAISGVQAIASGLNFPGFATHAPGDANRLFVAELPGNIKIIDLNTNSVTGTFLNIPDTDFAGEGGLLGLAFHPNYFAPEGTTGRGKFYVYVTVDNDLPEDTSPFTTRIREYSVLGDPATSNVADTNPDSIREILSFTQPQSNHNAGWIGFNPQVTAGQPQYLYISSGDGGGGFDDGAGHTVGTGNAQDITNNLLGKMLRIDVNGDDFPADAARNYAIPPTNPMKAGVGEPGDDVGDDEIWAYGLRNPFRNSFDRQTGDLWMGDVGQNQREEIDYQAESSDGGENYGWRLREGTFQTQLVGGPLQPGHTQPVYDYGRGSGPLLGETVIGGYRYRGPDPDLQGLYYFADANDDNVWQMTPPEPVVPNNAVVNIDGLLGNLVGIDRVVSFGEDANGNLYIIDMATGSNDAPNPNSGQVYRILTNKLLAGDFNADGNVDAADYNEWAASFGGPLANPTAEGAGGNGIADAADYVVWRKNLGASVHGGAGSSGQAAVPELTTSAIALHGLLMLIASAIARRR